METITQEADLLGECPVWDGEALWWVDIHARVIKRFDGRAVALYAAPEKVGSFALRAQGGLIAAMQSGIFAFDGARFEKLVDAPDPAVRFNDGRCDRAGRFWVGKMNDANVGPNCSLYLLTRNRLQEKRTGISIPNSLAFSPDGRTMYFADSPRRAIWAYDYDPASGEPSNERVFCTLEAGAPDGSCVDADGCLWNAEYGTSRVVRYTPAGKVDRVLELPATQVTCCCFGGAGLDTLFITTASQKLSAEQRALQPLAGRVFAANVGVKGLPESRFAG